MNRYREEQLDRFVRIVDRNTDNVVLFLPYREDRHNRNLVTSLLAVLNEMDNRIVELERKLGKA